LALALRAQRKKPGKEQQTEILLCISCTILLWVEWITNGPTLRPAERLSQVIDITAVCGDNSRVANMRIQTLNVTVSFSS
jgi:hypothetical protein